MKEQARIPFVSIIIPAYNAEKYIDDCLSSIINQSYKNIEIIIINDGSTDDTELICRKYSKKDERIRLIATYNQGVSCARNKGLEMAKGEWICFVDADDMLVLPDGLETLISHAVFSNADIINGNAYRLVGNEESLVLDFEDIIICQDIISQIKHLALWAQLFRHQIIKEHSIAFMEGLAYSEDAVFIVEFSQYAKKLEFVSKPVYIYRINEDSVCHSLDGQKKSYHHFLAAERLNCIRKVNSSLSRDTLKYIEYLELAKFKTGVTSFFIPGGNHSLIQLYHNFVDTYKKKCLERIFYFLYYLSITYVKLLKKTLYK